MRTKRRAFSSFRLAFRDVTAQANHFQRIVDAVDYFRSIAEAQREQPDVERLMDGYLDLRGELARDFKELATLILALDTSALGNAISRVNSALAARYGDAVDDSRLTVVRGYGGIRRVFSPISCFTRVRRWRFTASCPHWRSGAYRAPRPRVT